MDVLSEYSLRVRVAERNNLLGVRKFRLLLPIEYSYYFPVLYDVLIHKLVPCKRLHWLFSNRFTRVDVDRHTGGFDKLLLVTTFWRHNVVNEVLVRLFLID